MKKILAISMIITMIAASTFVVMYVYAGIGTSTYRVFYVHEQAIDYDGNGDSDKLDTLIATYRESDGKFEYIGEGVEPEISGDYIIWHSSDYTKLYVYHRTASSPFMPYWVREYTDDAELHGSGIAFNTLEIYAGLTGQDVNGDGDQSDKVVAYMSLSGFPASAPTITYKTGEKTERGGYDGTTLAYVKYEAQEGILGDLNGDFDTLDSVIYYMKPLVTFTETAAARKGGCVPGANQGTYPRVGGNTIVWTTDESLDNCNWGGTPGANDIVVAATKIVPPLTYFLDVTIAAYAGHHYAHSSSWFVYEVKAWDADAGSQTILTEDWGTTKKHVFVGEPIKIVGSTIIGYAYEAKLKVDLNNDSDTNDEAMWIHDKSTGQTEIITGGNKYWK